MYRLESIKLTQPKIILHHLIFLKEGKAQTYECGCTFSSEERDADMPVFLRNIQPGRSCRPPFRWGLRSFCGNTMHFWDAIICQVRVRLSIFVCPRISGRGLPLDGSVLRFKGRLVLPHLRTVAAGGFAHRKILTFIDGFFS